MVHHRTSATLRVSFLASAAYLAACGSTEGLTGTVAGRTVEVKSAAFVHFADDREQLAVVLTDAADACAAIGAGDVHLEIFESGANRRLKNTTVLSLILWGAPSLQYGGYAVAATFPPPSDRFAIAQLSRTDDTCASTLGDRDLATVGRVQLDQMRVAAGGTATGHLELTFGTDGGTLTGDFDADYCSLTPAKDVTPMCH